MKIIKDAVTKPEVSFWMALVIPLVGFAVQWGVLTSGIDSMIDKGMKLRAEFESHVIVADKRYDTNQERLLQIQVQLAEIATRQQEIQKSINELNRKIGE